MNKKHVTIQQTLHGYSNGHHLLESSILLSDESKRKMDMLTRPGCVWTRSLLICLEDLEFCACNINRLLSLFIRPNKKDSPNLYG